MRLLADENFPRAIVESLRLHGHDVLWARTECTGWKDSELLDRAEAQSRIVLTLDKDFWQIAIQRRTPLLVWGVVLFRVHPATPENLQPLMLAFVAAGQPWAGHVSIVSLNGIELLPAGRR
jgi:predicted nuclease of predicted toxin-antitoxin system